MNPLFRIKEFLSKVSQLGGDLDTAGAEKRIRKGIWFRGANVWILTFAIIIASVGLNVNSTAVIIGAMLISPVMGPILGIGLSIGTNNINLMKLSFKNLLTMVLISLTASCLFFLLSPLNLADPTELEARTSPTIFDVLIAFFGGAAGIVENSRKEQGTVISGVAIATALMPPLCTAGYGLSEMDMHFFLGAMYLFIINTVFIATATYIGVKLLHFPDAGDATDHRRMRARKHLITTIFVLVMIPSFLTAYVMIRDNNFTNNVRAFVAENRVLGKTYIYDYAIVKEDGNKVYINLAGEPLTDDQRETLTGSAHKHHLKDNQFFLQEGALGMGDDKVNSLVENIYKHTDESILVRDAQINELRDRIDYLDSLLKTHLIDTVAVKDTVPVLPEAPKEPEAPVDVNKILDLIKK